jgi:hypothetical protein
MPKQLFFAAMLTPRLILWRSCSSFLHKRRERVENSTRSFDDWGSRGTRSRLLPTEQTRESQLLLQHLG